MKNMKKWILSALCATCAFAGVATLQGNQEVATASAAVATEYEVVDTVTMVRLEDVYVDNGNFSLYVLVPELDTGDKKAEVNFGYNLDSVFENLGFFDKVTIGEKTLRELGCTTFWTHTTVGINSDGNGGFPYNYLHLYCHAEPETWKAAYNAGEVQFGKSIVTVKEGALIPGYAYLNGDKDAKLYRAGCDFATQSSTANYGITSYGKTEIESFEYVQGHDGDNGYLGVSLKGDDYLGDGQQVEINQVYKGKYKDFTSTIEMNGLTDQVGYYGLYNLGEKGQGYYSFQVDIHEDELETITIPAGTLFPARALDILPDNNILESGARAYPLVVYETQTTQTFYKNAEGKYVSFDGYLAGAKADLTAIREEKSVDCFAEDLDLINTTVSTALAALENATTIEDVDAAYLTAKETLNAIQTKTEAIAAAKADLDAYKAVEGYYRDAEKAQRDTIVADAKVALDGATTKATIETTVATAKTAIDALKSAAQYADEELADEKAAAKAEIEGYLADTEYLEEQATVRAEAIATGLQAVTEAKNSEEITAAVTAVKTAVDALETKASIVDAAKAELNAYKAEEGLYREAQATERANIIANCFDDMKDAGTQEAINAYVASAKAEIDTLKTDEELTAEEKDAANKVLAGEKEIGLEKINELKASVDYSKYTAENQAKINELYKTAKGLVEDALTAEEINAAVSAFETELNKVPQVEENNDNNNNDVTPDDNANTDLMTSLGCTSVVGVSGITALTLALGVAGLCLKKRKED